MIVKITRELWRVQSVGGRAGSLLKFNGLINFRKDIADLHRQLAGATPMLLRRSTLMTQSEIVLAVEREQIYSESRRRLSSCLERSVMLDQRL